MRDNVPSRLGGGANYAGQFGRRGSERARAEEVARAKFGAFSKLSQSYGCGAGDRGQQGAERGGRREGWGSLSLSLSLIFSFSHSLFRPPLGLPVVDFPPQWPVLDLVKLVSEITERDKEKPAAREENGSMSF